MELLYSLPAIGATQAGSAITCLNTAATAPPFQLPSLQNIWSPSSLTGKGLFIVAAGGYDISAANTLTTLRLSFDAASGTTANNTAGATGALSGGPFGAAATSGAWELQCWLTCVGISTELNSNWYSQGQLQFSGTASTGVATSYAFGNTVTAGIPQTFAMSNATSYFVNLCAQWQASPVAMVCSQLMVFGLD
jgi:hypothetical protein